MKKNILLFTIICYSLQPFAQSLIVANLKCEHKINPLGIESINPTLSWQLQSKQNSVVQKAFRILVSDNLQSLQKNIGNSWDSKKVLSDESILVPFQGNNLIAGKTYFWKVEVWDNKNNMSWSDVAYWQMGLISKQDWNDASWIAYEKLPDSSRIIPAFGNRGPKNLPFIKNTLPILRKEFLIDKQVKKATMFICGLGQFELSMNGQKIGDHFLDPGWTQYDKEALYVSLDVTPHMKKGENAIGVMLGNGLYFMPRQRYRKLTSAFGFPKMIAKLVVEFEDGTIKTIVTDQSWKTAESPITYSSIYGGEDYDANLEQPGWNTSSFNDKMWKYVIIEDGPPKLKSQMAEPLKVFETFVGKKSSKVKDSAYV